MEGEVYDEDFYHEFDFSVCDNFDVVDDWANLIFTDDSVVETTVVIGEKSRLGIYKDQLEHMKSDVKYVKEQFQKQISRFVDPFDKISFESVLYFFFCSYRATWRTTIEDRIDEGLRVQGIAERLGKMELYSFLETLFACHFYGKSPTALHDKKMEHNFVKLTMKFKRFEQILHALGERESSVEGNYDRWDPPTEALKNVKDCLDDMAKQGRSLVCTKGMSASIDDDKLRHRSSSSAQALNLQRTAQRGSGKPGPTQLSVIHKGKISSIDIHFYSSSIIKFDLINITHQTYRP